MGRGRNGTVRYGKDCVSHSVFLTVYVCLEDRVYVCQVSLSSGLEPFRHIIVEAKVNGNLAPGMTKRALFQKSAPRDPAS
jgi:hypothetical protein